MDKEFIFNGLVAALPDCSRETANEVSDALFNAGLNVKERLSFVREEDLIGYLSPFQTRVILDRWQSGASTSSAHHEASGEHDKRTHDAAQQAEKSSDSHGFTINWVDIYQINRKLKGKLEAGKKINKRERREIVKRLVTQVRRKPHLTRAIFNDVTLHLKKRYPISFKSELANGKMNKGSLGKQMKDKFDNDSRAKRSTGVESEAPKIKAAYGCKKWRQALPSTETKASQESIRVELVLHYEEKRPGAWDHDGIKNKMNLTYASQRAEINSQAEQIARKAASLKQRPVFAAATEQMEDNADITTVMLRKQWPFLFVPQFMLQHFFTLTQVDLGAKFQEFLSKDVTNLLEFLTQTTKKKKKLQKALKEAIERNPESKVPHLIAVLVLLIRRFKEETSALWLIVPDYAREEEIPSLTEIPLTPSIIVAGESIFKGEKYYFSMDGNVITSVKDFLEGISLLFASYFVFNLEYSAWGQITLEFIQRCIAAIDPEKGNKRPSKDKGGHHSTRKIHPTLVTINNKYDEFFADLDSYEESSDEIL